jgi:hypothetical protein
MAFTTIGRSRKRPTLTTSTPRAASRSPAAPRREILHLKTVGAEPASAAPAERAN